jgi:DNA-directed RNA polymerase subunit RPC12/RpoP
VRLNALPFGEIAFVFEPEPQSPPKLECPTCGAVDEHGEDFCFECGHAFAHGKVDVDDAREPRGATCPMCSSGELELLSNGARQCDSCGYTARDWAHDSADI